MNKLNEWKLWTTLAAALGTLALYFSGEFRGRLDASHRSVIMRAVPELKPDLKVAESERLDSVLTSFSARVPRANRHEGPAVRPAQESRGRQQHASTAQNGTHSCYPVWRLL